MNTTPDGCAMCLCVAGSVMRQFDIFIRGSGGLHLCRVRATSKHSAYAVARADYSMLYGKVWYVVKVV